MPSNHCFVLRGDRTANGFIASRRDRPFIASSNRSPPFPLAIYYPDQEYNNALHIIQSVALSLHEPRPNGETAIAFIEALRERRELEGTSLYTKTGFYPVVYGKHVGVYFSWDDVEDEVNGRGRPRRFQHVRTIRDALVYMITKGASASVYDLLRHTNVPLPPCDIPPDISPARRNVSVASSSGRTTRHAPSRAESSHSHHLQQSLPSATSRHSTSHRSVAPLLPPVPLLPLPLPPVPLPPVPLPPVASGSALRKSKTKRPAPVTPVKMSASTSRQTPSNDPREDPAVQHVQEWLCSTTLSSPFSTLSSINTGSEDAPYCYRRTLAGIIDSVYDAAELEEQANMDPPTEDLLGSAAYCYFATHGFLPGAVWTAYNTFKVSWSKAHFIAELNSKGAAELEAAYMFDLLSGRWQEIDRLAEAGLDVEEEEEEH
ncbi:hypothetical protein CONPUDRAFT_154796 [Coniophora puteana RWD-64-598 SS2]|uniref:Uncharacterized protein n=1 Tax=Coniophora puteana (strain RWD-64-598) TaxID=741705 RepID=A0A5M3MNR5_CONPW|nr:uncharacterized protein CONPUDRAFT_154796 [Coniophora puteana RWD-64-598 SS2]EIW80798.1 hypothetical protein CONPUDRAFT_154796 [Coniophora puteana RWD-64-598 SS2]